MPGPQVARYPQDCDPFTYRSLGQLGDVAANTQRLTLRFTRDDEIDADLVGLEMAARGLFCVVRSARAWRVHRLTQINRGNPLPPRIATHDCGK